MGRLRDRMDEDLRLRGYADSTRKIYLLYARLFVARCMKPPQEITEPEVRAFLLHLIEERGVSRTTYRQYLAAIKFLFTVTLGRPWLVERLRPQRRERRLPEVMSPEEVAALLDAAEGLRFRTVFALMYAAGLRISEACRLRIEDVDSKRMLIRVRRGKGNKDREVMLSMRLLEMLREYWRQARPASYFFPSPGAAGHLDPATVRERFRRARLAAGVTRRVTPHALRHSFATHLLDDGTDIAVTARLLGHASVRTTAIYTHVTTRLISRTRSPLDLLPEALGRETDAD